MGWGMGWELGSRRGGGDEGKVGRHGGIKGKVERGRRDVEGERKKGGFRGLMFELIEGGKREKYEE